MSAPGRLSQEYRAWLATWNGTDELPGEMKVLLVARLNSIIDGPAIEEEPLLAIAFPRPMMTKVAGFPRDLIANIEGKLVQTTCLTNLFSIR